MHFALCRAAARCQVRRGADLATAAPLPAIALLGVAFVAPVMLARVGTRIGDALADAIGSAGIASALVLGPALGAALLGAVVAVSTVGRSGLGTQLEAGPYSNCLALLVGLIVPAAAFVAVVMPCLLSMSVFVGRQLPGGAPGGLALAAATVASAPFGALLAEGCIGLARRDRRPVLVVAGVLVGWLLAGMALGAAALGPLAPTGDALVGTGSPWRALGTALLLTVGLGSAWALLASRRAEPAQRNVRTTRAIVRGGSLLAVLTSVVALIVRRHDVRVAAVASVCFGLAGVGVTLAAAAPTPTPFLFATTTALLGSVLAPLVVAGVLAAGRWVWVGGQPRALPVATLGAVVGLVGAALPVAVVGALALLLSGSDLPAIGIISGYVGLGSAAALIAGALVPWSSSGVGEQMSTFAVLAGLAIGVSVVLGVVGPRLSAFAPAAVVLSIVGALWLASAVVAVASRLEIPEP